ncbi:MAG: RdgB/HAM1 family non-canonical purine NTP pyrophosphatase [Planctomycetota bacterium]
MSSILLASQNRDKRREIIRALGATPDSLLTPDDVGPDSPDPVEDADNYLDNAIIKAREFSHWSGLPALADDSGLECNGLAGAPGVFSARFAGPKATYEDNCQLLLERLVDVADRSAQFRCVLVCCVGDEVVYHTEGVCTGTICASPRGAEGFGYDPVFVPTNQTRSFAEMTAAEKDAISHRGRALQQLAAAVTNGDFPIPMTRDRGAV